MTQDQHGAQDSQDRNRPVPQEMERPGPGWASLMERRDNQYHQWDSLLGATVLGDLTMVPLTDERQLFEETSVMMHGVCLYGEKCALGEARIFSVRRQGQPDSTLELVPKDNRWVVAQIRGPRNIPASQDSREAADRLADQYTQAWQQTPEHNSWQVNNTG